MNLGSITLVFKGRNKSRTQLVLGPQNFFRSLIPRIFLKVNFRR